MGDLKIFEYIRFKGLKIIKIIEKNFIISSKD